MSSVLISRALGPDGRGFYQLVATTAVLIASVGGLSAELAVAHLVAQRPKLRERLIATIVVGAWVWGGLLALLALVIGYIAPLGPQWSQYGLQALGALTLLALVGTWTQRALLLQAMPRAAALMSLTEAGLAFACIVLAYRAERLTTPLVLAVTAAASLVACVLSSVIVRPRPRAARARSLVEALRIGATFHPGQVALQLLIRLDIVLLASIDGLAAVGIYSVAVSLTTPLAVFGTTVASTFMHRQFSGDDDTAAGHTSALIGLSLTLLLPVAVTIGALAPFLIPWVWGEDFQGATLPLLLLLPGVLAMSFQRPIGQFFVRTRRARVMNVRALAATSANVVLCLVLIPWWGESGAALASTLAYMVYAGMSFLAYRRQTGHGLVAIWRASSQMLRPLGRYREGHFRAR